MYLPLRIPASIKSTMTLHINCTVYDTIMDTERDSEIAVKSSEKSLIFPVCSSSECVHSAIDWTATKYTKTNVTNLHFQTHCENWTETHFNPYYSAVFGQIVGHDIDEKWFAQQTEHAF